jgi:hypothetical protein
VTAIVHVRFPRGLENAPTHVNTGRTSLSTVGTTQARNSKKMEADRHSRLPTELNFPQADYRELGSEEQKWDVIQSMDAGCAAVCRAGFRAQAIRHHAELCQGTSGSPLPR